ncbi:MAG: hypothetical protein QG656_2757, partial [Candidatus Hydrogenedentes bacterium]|nr:hypothetical protein [Candidatus Hydrogenedentota bacterium]
MIPVIRMNVMASFCLCGVFLLAGPRAVAEGGADMSKAIQTVERSLPRPMPSHPGNVFLADEAFTLPTGNESETWRIIDDREVVVASGALPVGGVITLSAGTLSVGWYRIEWLDADSKTAGMTTAAVLEPLKVPTPQDSPICIDAAAAWFARNDSERQDQFAALAALAGANWIR